LLTKLATVLTSQTLQSSAPVPAQEVQEMAPPELPRRGRARRGARAKFTGFEDDFSVPLSSAPQSIPVDERAGESQSLFMTQNSDMDVDRETSQPSETQTRNNRKRVASPIIEEEVDILEQMAPTAATMKRRRLARGEPTPPPPPPVKEKPTVTKAPAKKAKKEMDVLAVAREKREEAEERQRAEREALQEQREGMDIEEMRDLAIIEEMEVKRTAPAPRAAARADESERWDDKWNGRKNFKKFRRRGAEAGPVREKIIIELEEVKKKDFGIGDEYWDAGDSQRRRKKDKGKGKETQSQIVSQSRPKSRAVERAAQILASEAEEEFGDAGKGDSDSDLEIVERPQRQMVITTSQSQKSQKLADKTSETKNLPAGSSNKRAAEKVLTKPAPVKRARQTRLTKPVSDNSDDDDGFTFRFKKR
jgi:nijmegen breakage syndrome protein 1